MDALTPEEHRHADASRAGFFGTRPQLIAMVAAVVFLAICGYFTIAALSGARDARILPPGAAQGSAVDSLRLMSPPERRTLIAREQAALRNDPLDRTALKNLIVLWRSQDEAEMAERLAVLAGDRSLRDLRAQAEVLDILLARKDYAAALYRLDALMRAQPERKPDLIKIAALFAEADESRPALVAAISGNPPWRQDLITSIMNGPNGPAIAYGIFSELRKNGKHASYAELRALISKLIARRDYDTAYFVWLDFLSPQELRKAANVYDGAFELDARNMLFGWNFEKLKNTDIRLVPRSTSTTDRMLRVEFMNPSERFQNVSQILRLAPGLYNFSGEMKAERLETEVGLVWRIYCMGEKENVIAATGKLFASSTWAPIELPFEIPAENCAAQRLRLEVASRSALDHRITGQVYFDNFQIKSRR